VSGTPRFVVGPYSDPGILHADSLNVARMPAGN
jgi:hypothetical protein